MNKLLSLLAAAALFAACSQNPSGPQSGMPLPLKSGGGGGSTPAHPAWTFEYDSTIKSGHNNYLYSTVAVSDSDGTHLADVYLAPSSSVNEKQETWSPGKSSVSFVEFPSSGTGTFAIKAVDVSVNSNGVPVGSNARTILSSSSLAIHYQAWCPNSSIAKIAFAAKSGSSWGVYTVSTSGGTPTLLYDAGSNVPGWLTWSPDGSQLAFWYADESTSPATFEIKVINASTGSENATLVSGSYAYIFGLEWTHGSSDLLCYAASTTNNQSGSYYLYTISPTSGSSPSSAIANVNGPVFWSPNDAEVLCNVFNSSEIATKVTVASGTTSSVGAVPYGDWK